ncbi:MAG: clostripain [Phocaeicola sp.]|nr:clostripain [Phocaeicola sp.]
MKKILFIFLAACFFFSCEKETIVIPQRHAGRTILAFFWANNNLSDNLRRNIMTMMNGLTEVTDSATLLVYWDGYENSTEPNWKTPTILRYTANGRGGINGYSKNEIEDMFSNSSRADIVGIGVVEKSYPSQISTKKQVMQTVISDMMECYPSESYGIIFGSHGSGWLPTITGTRSIGVDGVNANTAVIPELAEVLRTVNPQKFDFVLFDACMMGCAEVYYELKDATRYCIASVLDVPALGFPYERLMSHLYADNFKDHLVSICKNYIDYYNYNGWGTVSAVDCNQMEGLAQDVRKVILSNQENLKSVDAAELQQYGKAGNNFKGYAYDMVQFVENLTGGTVPEEFVQQFNKAVIYTGYTPNPTSSLYRIDGNNYCGMGMYIPNSSTTSKYLLWNNYFRSSIAWYHASGWAETESIWGN